MYFLIGTKFNNPGELQCIIIIKLFKIHEHFVWSGNLNNLSDNKMSENIRQKFISRTINLVFLYIEQLFKEMI